MSDIDTTQWENDEYEDTPEEGDEDPLQDYQDSEMNALAQRHHNG